MIRQVAPARVQCFHGLQLAAQIGHTVHFHGLSKAVEQSMWQSDCIQIRSGISGIVCRLELEILVLHFQEFGQAGIYPLQAQRFVDKIVETGFEIVAAFVD